MTGTDDTGTGGQGTEDSRTEPPPEDHDEFTQHGADDVSEEWDVQATDPRPTGAGEGETPEAAAQGTGGRDGNLAESGRFHGEQNVSPEAE